MRDNDLMLENIAAFIDQTEIPKGNVAGIERCKWIGEVKRWGEVDYMQIDSLQRQVNAHSASISSAQSRVTTIDEQLERLRTARSL